MRADLQRLRRDSTSARVASTTASRAAGAPSQRRFWIAAGAAALVVAMTAAFWYARGARRPDLQPGAPATAGTSSIAVLPFVDMSPAKDQEYFADGLSEELLNVLAQIRELRVTGRTSSFQFKGKAEDLRVIGQKLNVATILEGSVRKAGTRVRITAQLVKVADGFHLWSETYDRELDDIFAVQDDIARAVSSALKLTLLGKDGSHAAERRHNAAAYNLYLQGQYFRARQKREDLEKAVSYYEQALAARPRLCPRLGRARPSPTTPASESWLYAQRRGPQKSASGGGESPRAGAEPRRSLRGSWARCGGSTTGTGRARTPPTDGPSSLGPENVVASAGVWPARLLRWAASRRRSVWAGGQSKSTR